MCCFVRQYGGSACSDHHEGTVLVHFRLRSLKLGRLLVFQGDSTYSCPRVGLLVSYQGKA